MSIESLKDFNSLIGKKIKVLDDGFVCLVDYMGNDSSIVQAARVSYGAGTKTVNEDRGLIRYLLRHRHTTPLEMCEIKLHVRVPMDIWRQWIRHRTASVNEYSTRYSEAINSAHKTNPDEWRFQSKSNKQGSLGTMSLEDGERLSSQEVRLHDICRSTYESRLKAGVAREQARKDLPLSTYTEAYWKIDLHNLLHFLSLRIESAAQKEIRDYANAIASIVKEWVPLTWEAFVDYRLEAVSFSRLELEVLGYLVKNNPEEAYSKAKSFGWFDKQTNRERSEFELKIKKIGMKNVFWMV